MEYAIGIWDLKRPVLVRTPDDLIDLMQNKEVLHETAYQMLSKHAKFNRELLTAFHFDPNTRVRAVQVISVGNRDQCLASKRDIFRHAMIREDTAALVIAHNHPLNILPNPSNKDIAMTKMYVDAGKTLDTPIMDHIILVESNWSSMMHTGTVFEKGAMYNVNVNAESNVLGAGRPHKKPKVH